MGLAYSLARTASSTTSTRRSPDSHFDTNDCRFPRRRATWTWEVLLRSAPGEGEPRKRR